MTAFWHYTCEHSFRLIGGAGLVKPLRMWKPDAEETLGKHRWMAGVSWFTDLDPAPRLALRLTTERVQCDRMRYRYRVTDPALLARWIDVGRKLAPLADWRLLNWAEGAMPAHWWVATAPVPVEVDRAYGTLARSA